MGLPGERPIYISGSSSPADQNADLGEAVGLFYMVSGGEGLRRWACRDGKIWAM